MVTCDNSGSDTDEELSSIEGVWNNSAEIVDSNGQLYSDENFLVVRANGTITEFDFQGDGTGSGFNCYISRNGMRVKDSSEMAFSFNNRIITFDTTGENTKLLVGTPQTGTPIRSKSVEEIYKLPISEQDLTPACTVAQLPYADTDIPTWRPAVFNQRILPLHYTQGIDCPALTGTADVGELAGVWNVTTITGRNDPTSTIIIKSTSYVHISQSGEVTHYDLAYEENFSDNQCYRVETGMSLLSVVSDSLVQGKYYKDKTCELREIDFSVERFSNLPRTSDLLHISQVLYDLNGIEYATRTARFPEMTFQDLNELSLCQ